MGHDLENGIPGSIAITPDQADTVRAMLAAMDDGAELADMLGLS